MWYNFDELSHLARRFGAGRILHAAVTVVGDHVQVTACLCDVRHNLGPTAVVDYASETEAMNGMAELATSLVEALTDPPRSDLEPTERDQQIRR